MENYTISYEPLRKILKEREIRLSVMMSEIGVSSRTRTKISKDEAVSLSTIGKICVYLSVKIENVVKIELQK